MDVGRMSLRTCRAPVGMIMAGLAVVGLVMACGGPPGDQAAGAATSGRSYPGHTNVVATTFWVGEVFDPDAPDGSQVISTYDSAWQRHYGGCDGIRRGERCDTERRTIDNGYFPQHMTPKQNPFYLDLPFDDINDRTAFAMRCNVVPWAQDPGFAGHCTDQSFSYLKNHWVRITGPNDRVCYGQIEDAGPGQYHDAEYVFGDKDSRPANTRYGGAGADVSPALNGCLGFSELDGDTDRVSWRFVDEPNVPDGPWKRVVTTGGLTE